jgi:dienelactone hydrolase
MRKVLDDASRGVSLLGSHPRIEAGNIGIMGHSYGGSTTLFQMALDQRLRFGCSSGAACSYRYTLAHQLGVEMSLAIPGFFGRFDKDDLVKCIAPRPFLVVSASEDVYSMDAADIVASARPVYEDFGQGEKLEHSRYEGPHGLTEERFGRIVDWLAAWV